MDTKAYIESGIIESYVLGLTSPEEAAELESLCALHADIQQAVDDFAAAMERNAFENAVPPPSSVKDKLLDILQDDFKTQAPVISMPAEKDTDDFKERKPMWKYMAAASIILLVGSALLNVYLYSNYKNTSDKYQALLTETHTLQANSDVMRTRLNDFEESMRVIENPAIIKVSMPGISGHENSLATVYWDSQTKDVYLLPNKLAALPEGKQYQLWAIVDGKPVDAGIMDNCNGLCKMKNIPRAQTFAITVEKAGGSATPDIPSMVVAGNVGS